VIALHLALLLVRAEEAWEPVLLGGLIPILGALGIVFLIWYAVRQKPEGEEKKGKGEKEKEEG
jgi:hypothetical protein